MCYISTMENCRICYWIVYTLLSLILTNALLSMFTYNKVYPIVRPYSPREDWKDKTDKNISACCNCTELQQNNLHKTQHFVNYAHVAKETPYLDPDYRTSTLTRLGTDLNFDLLSCPKDSFMRNPNSSFIPEHLDCPTLFLIGARKGGTSSLYQYLSKHPDFEGTRLDAGPKVGETFYFSSSYKHQSWDWYLHLFPSDGMMTGDASVGNLVECTTPKRLYSLCGKQARVVVLLRDPVDRFVSNFLMRVRYHTTRMQNMTSITSVVNLHLDNLYQQATENDIDISRISSQPSRWSCLFNAAVNLVYEGLYYPFIMNWMCNFPAENILIINSEEFYEKPELILKQVFQFLGLKMLDSETSKWITANVYNRGDYSVPSYQKLSNTDLENLLKVYNPSNEALLKLLGWQDHIQWKH